MKRQIGALALLVLVGCVTPPRTPAADFDPSACYERSFNIYFENDDDQLSAPAREAIDTVQNQLRGCHIDSVRILGLAEAEGTPRAAVDLSARRALYVAQYMERERGWSRDKIQTLAAGEAGAVTEEGLAQPMRRVARITVHASAPAA